MIQLAAYKILILTKLGLVQRKQSACMRLMLDGVDEVVLDLRNVGAAQASTLSKGF